MREWGVRVKHDIWWGGVRKMFVQGPIKVKDCPDVVLFYMHKKSPRRKNPRRGLDGKARYEIKDKVVLFRVETLNMMPSGVKECAPSPMRGRRNPLARYEIKKHDKFTR